MSSIATAYLDGATNLAAFYAGMPGELFSRTPQGRAWAPGVAEEVRTYQKRLGLERDFNGDEALIITGQQPAYFGGPFYCVLKAATAILLARKLSARHGTKVLPLYWVGSDDHDFEEAATAYFINRRHELFSEHYAPQAATAGRSLHRIPAEAGIHDAIERVADACVGSEFAEDVRALLHESLDAADSLSDWSTRILARLFRDTELLFAAPHLQGLRLAAKDIMKREIDAPLQSTRILNDAAARLAALGYDVQLQKGQDEANFFVEFGELRRKTLYKGGKFHIPDEDLFLTAEEMHTFLEESPERFSPNVVSRCAVQQALFPCAAYVGGPGEIAYWAQMKDVLAHFSVAMPIIYPRAHALFTSLKLNKLRDKHKLEITALQRGPEQILESVLRNSLQSPGLEIVRKYREEVKRGTDKLQRDLLGAKGIPPEALELCGKLEAASIQGVERIERALLHADTAQVDATRKQIVRLCDTLAPLGKAQDRVLSVFSFLFEHGFGLVPKLLDVLDVESFTQQEIEL